MNPTTTATSAWLSQGIEELFSKPQPSFDVVIVGSGYGGSIAAHELAGWRNPDGSPLSICLLERGREYLPGQFPENMRELPGHCRFQTSQSGQVRGVSTGLFDLRLGADVNVLLANGLGGGSLINAGVMLRPTAAVLTQGWPEGLNSTEFQNAFAAAEQLLSTQTLSQGSPPTVTKAKALQALQPHRFKEAPLSISQQPDPASHTQACTRCGNCATGCNQHAKRSLDVQLLAQAKARSAHLHLYTGAEVLDFSRQTDGWRLKLQATDANLARHLPKELEVKARILILAAGSLGTPELLLRSTSLSFSSRLGQQFSTNGDSIHLLYQHSATPVKALAYPGATDIGPSISALLDYRDQPEPLLVQELAVPVALKPLLQEGFGLNRFFQQLADGAQDPAAPDRCKLDESGFQHSSILAVIGHDSAQGQMQLVADPSGGPARVRLHWPNAGLEPVYQHSQALLQRLRNGSGQLLANPLWQLLPPALAQQLDGGQTPGCLSVHPLGGCPMGNQSPEGVVNQWGQVFDPTQALPAKQAKPNNPESDSSAADNSTADGPPVYDNLVILDGSIIPRSLGVNPALTISALSLRAIRELRLSAWQLLPPVVGMPLPLPARPRFANPKSSTAAPAELTLIERLHGPVQLDGKRYQLELELHFKPVPVGELLQPQHYPQLPLNPELSRLRLRSLLNLPSEAPELGPIEFEQPLSGHLQFFVLNAKPGFKRQLSSLWHWFRTRGLRDSRQAGFKLLLNVASLRTFHALLQQAAQGRSFDYRLQLGTPLPGSRPELAQFFPDQHRLHGHKYLGYQGAVSPWQQLQSLQLSGLAHHPEPVRLQLDLPFFARQDQPLIRISRQDNSLDAWVELLQFGLYCLRVMVQTHFWSFRLPDPVPLRPAPNRFARELPGLGLKPDIIELPVQDPGAEQPIQIRLTAYRQPSALPPVLMIHGYSTSSTTFSHPSLQPGLASALYQQGREVWLVDLRSSCALPTGIQSWSFEQVAFNDLPVAINHILQTTGHSQLDIVAHCMGAAMLSMAILGDAPLHSHYQQELQRLKSSIRRVVLSQIGPRMQMSPINLFRAYLASYLRHYLGIETYRFQTSAEPELAEQLLDRLLASYPFPDAELRQENPLWTFAPYVTTRHRMAALYGRNFSLANLSPAALAAMDELFGPGHLDLVAQVIHFSQTRNISTIHGQNPYLTPKRLSAYWRFPTLAIHGADNELSDPLTLDLVKQLLTPYCAIETRRFTGLGHQDCLIGHSTGPVFAAIGDFLNVTQPERQTKTPATQLSLHLPWLGPVHCYSPQGQAQHYALAADPTLGSLSGVAVVAVQRQPTGFKPLAIQYCPLPSSPMANVNPGDWQHLPQPGFSQDATPRDGLLWLMVSDQINPTRNFSGHLWLQPAAVKAEAEELKALRLRRISPHSWAPPATPLKEAIDAFLHQHSTSDLQLSLVPDPSASSGIFALASCQYPAGILDAEPAYASLNRLSQLPPALQPDWLILTGDQVYIDATADLFDPSLDDDYDRYLRPYQRLWRQPAFRQLLKTRPVYMLLDDHEIHDQYEADKADSHRAKHYYWQFQRIADLDWHQPPQTTASGSASQSSNRPLSRPDSDSDSADLDFEFCEQGLSFLLLDSRSRRSPRSPGNPGDMLSAVSWQRLQTWLHQSVNQPRFIVSASMPLPRRKLPSLASPNFGLTLDSWQGYPTALLRLLEQMADAPGPLVLLSGDEHLSCVARIRLKLRDGRERHCYSIHSSGLYCPLEFVNSQPDDFIAQERFCPADLGQSSGLIKEIEVDTKFYPGDGFALLKVEGSQVFYRFDRANADTDWIRLEPLTRVYEPTDVDGSASIAERQ